MSPERTLDKSKSSTKHVRRVAVALQGGGSHGAFTWGVLDRLLEEPDLEIAGISGTSAGAMNAAILADGLLHGGREKAKKALANYWHDVGRIPGYDSIAPRVIDGERVWHLEANPLFVWHGLLTRLWSPYEMNPFNYNPLRGLLGRIDFEGLRTHPDAARIFICATNVRTGLRRVFENHELTVEVLLASAALPQVYQAVEIDGEHYWDGGYTGNPALAPLHLFTDATDVIVVGINPIVRAELPRTARAIIDRTDEISFNASLMTDVAAIAFIEELMQGRPERGDFKRLHLHGIGDDTLGSFGASSKMNNNPDFLDHLHALGRRSTERWLVANRDAVGERSTVDLSGLVPSRHGSLIGPSLIKHSTEHTT